MDVMVARVDRVLTRAGGYLRAVSSHSLQPYRGCAYGSSLCGSACYVQHNDWVMKGRVWGSFLEVRENAAESYLRTVAAERRWARRAVGRFSIFMSSSTDPFVPQEARFGITRGVLAAMCQEPPDLLIMQSHSHRVAACLALYRELALRSALRVHISVETDRERIPGLPPHAGSVQARLEAAARLKAAGIFTVITVAPLLPIADPGGFFARVGECAHAVVLDHFVGGDGTPDGRRTARTPLPAAMEALEPGSSALAYRDVMEREAERAMPGRVGVGAAGFAGVFSGAVNLAGTSAEGGGS